MLRRNTRRKSFMFVPSCDLLTLCFDLVKPSPTLISWFRHVGQSLRITALVSRLHSDLFRKTARCDFPSLLGVHVFAITGEM